MNIGNAIVLILAVAALFVGVALGLFDLSPMALLGNGLVAVVFSYVGLMLGRRSDKANAYADEIRAKLRAYEAKLREHGISLPR